jgi:hypothetical protein
MRAKGSPRPEIWVAEALADAWGFAPAVLGRYETGTQMADAAVTQLTFPPKAQLVAYATRCFALAEDSVAALSDEDLLWPAEIAAGREPWFSPPKEPNLVIRFLMLSSRHDARHLGMVEALKGLQGERGTATA